MDEENDALMRARGAKILDGVDLATVRAIDVGEAKCLAESALYEGDLSPSDLHALALWAAKGGMLLT